MKLINFGALIVYAVTTVKADSYAHQIQWLRDKGGFFSDKIKRSSNGSFVATAPIKKNEEIIMIPASAMITGGRYEDMCQTARNLLEEYYSEDESAYAPYAQYVFESFPHDEHPLAWSDAATDLFMSIVGEDLEPKAFGENSFEDNCEYDEDDDEDDEEDLAAAYRIVVARGWQDKLVPILDLINHRNGKYHNVDQTNSVHDNDDVSVVAVRDISEGEQIYYSYNECNDIDCEGIEYSYVTPQIFADYGFVEQYPRRFNFNTYGEDYATFEIDKEDNGDMKLDWISDPPDIHDINYFRGNLKRLHQMNATLFHAADDLADYERNLIFEYYEAIVTALEVAISWESQENEMEQKECAFDDDHEEKVCTEANVYSDSLNDAPHLNSYRQSSICKVTVEEDEGTYELSSEMAQSHYQTIEFKEYLDINTGNKNKCLFLQGWVQTCTSFRPHYHEWLIHYPASFLKEVKRVLFIGGGDNMILHEVLKYPSLELVVGMELDQQVVRGSFKNMGIQPHFDVDAVQWWFGDASKSIQMLPEDYYGTFDLVVVDLQSYVIESLLVTKELNIMDFAMLLLKPEGILTQNEDFVPRTNVDFARYAVDLELNDVPYVCQQSINMGSNAIDFSRAGRVDHGVDTVVFNSTAAGDFHAWWNYRHNAHRKSKVSAPAVMDNDETGERSRVVTTTRGDQGGTILILEVEEVAEESSKRTLPQIKDLMVGVLETVGLKVLSSTSHDSESVFILLQEGYVTLRSFGDVSGYYACDLYFWSNFDMQDEAKAGLVSALGGQSSSSFRVVTSGMIQSPRSLRVPVVEDEADMILEGGLNITLTALSSTEMAHLDVVLKEMATLFYNGVLQPTVAVVCAEDITACSSLEILRQLQDSKSMNIVSVRSCVSEASPQKEPDCEKDVISALDVEGKIDGIVIDPLVSRKMGQVLREVLAVTNRRENLLKKKYVIVAPFAASSGSWRKALMERFRTDMLKYRPSFHADISIFAKDTTEVTNQGRLNIFSTGNESFYAHLFEALNRIETTRGNGDISTRVNYVRDGVLNYIADFKASQIVTDLDYDNFAAREQWKSQRPVGLQSVIQFEINRLRSPLNPGTRVLAKVGDDFFTGEWSFGEVESKNDDGTFDVILDRGGIIKSLQRDLIRKWEEDREISISDRVLVKYETGDWYQGTVLKEFSDNEYEVHVHNGHARLYKVHKGIMIRQYEEVQDNDDAVAKVSSILLKIALYKAIANTVDEQRTPNVKIEVYKDVQDGIIVSAFWYGGNAIVNWDGGHNFSLNLATYGDDEVKHELFRDTFSESFDFDFTVTSHDRHPRGFGRVVNSRNEN